ncbi:MAG: hypothetical protein K8L99_02000, partial [Anaerolineae bacterium]|nr:hypothetical protein [Anaerolineae bacterium]
TFVNLRDGLGGASPTATVAILDHLLAHLNSDAQWIADTRKHIERANNSLTESVIEIVTQ